MGDGRWKEKADRLTLALNLAADERDEARAQLTAQRNRNDALQELLDVGARTMEAVNAQLAAAKAENGRLRAALSLSVGGHRNQERSGAPVRSGVAAADLAEWEALADAGKGEG